MAVTREIVKIGTSSNSGPHEPSWPPPAAWNRHSERAGGCLILAPAGSLQTPADSSTAFSKAHRMLKVAPPGHSPVSARFHCLGDARIFAARSTRSASHRPTSALVVGAGAGSVVCDTTAGAANPTLARLARMNMRVWACIGLSPLGVPVGAPPFVV